MSQARLGVDIGGTFTDVVLEIGSKTYSTKILTTYKAPEDAIVEGMQQVCQDAGIQTKSIEQIIHGTTLATNALIERRGAKTALITTKGFRDVIEMRSESRFEQYDLNLELPDPLLSRNQRYVVSERVDANGNVLTPLSIKDVNDVIDRIDAAGYESVAVGLLHSYMNSDHEKTILKELNKRLPNVMVSLSSNVSPQMREYERFNTTIANAYIQPLIKTYLSRLKSRLRDEGADCPVFLMHSGGGIMSLESASEFPVRLVESGPAGGAIFAADIAARHGLEKVLSFDMGGTTAKICLIKNQTPKTARVFEVARTYRFKKGSGMPISIPVIDMVEIGAGGGSLAHVDGMNQIRVGPESAGSEPGPACYGRNGMRPAVTDADLVLGKLDPHNFAGGSFALDLQASKTALLAHLGNKVSITAQEAALGLAEVVDENMANAARVHAVENGEDLSEYTMIAFGGAAPLHAARLCEKLGVSRCLIPPGAGVGSAIGFLRAPFSFESNRSDFVRLSDLNSDRATSLLKDMKKEAEGFVRSCDENADILTEYKIYMRYEGQGWEIPVRLTAAQAAQPSRDVYQSLFEAEYTKLFGRAVEDIPVEITVWSVNAITKSGVVEKEAANVKSNAIEGATTRSLFDAGQNEPVEATCVRRVDIKTGDFVAGPAIVSEDETTIVVPSSREISMAGDGTLFMEMSGDAPKSDKVDDVTNVGLQVMWNRLISVVEEQAQALVRTAFSTSVREAGDLSAGVYDVDGKMLAQAVTGTPGHVNAMADAVAHFIRRIGRETMKEGDVYVTNDPWEGTGHLHDITMVTPSFLGSELVGFFACTAHIVDIGGRGFGADAASVYEEGLYLPIMRFADQGKVDATLVRIVRGNVREPDQLIGDMYALATCNEIGHRRLMEMMHEFNLSDLQGVSKYILDNSRDATLDRINRLTNATATGEMTVDGFDSPITLKTKISIEENRIVTDFTGTSGLDKKGINCPLVYTKAYACYALKCAIAPDIPNNAASLAPFEVIAPENSIVHALHPAPVALRHIVGHFVPDAVYNALDKILPHTVPAEGAGCLCNFQVSLRPRTDQEAPSSARRAEVLTFNSGGSGARPTVDGLNATAFPSGVMTMPVEATEQAGPIIIWRKEFRQDSGGAGAYRGGLGQFMEVGAQDGHEFDFQAMFDRVDHPARGRNGGKSGAPTTIGQDNGTSMRGKGKQFVAHGRRVELALPGGAGYGDPKSRDRALVKRDLARGYISENTAMDIYGLTLDDIETVRHQIAKGDFV